MASKNPKKVFGLICGFRGESGCVLLLKNSPFCCGGNCEEKSSDDGVWKEPEPKKLLGCLVFESCVYDQSNIYIPTVVHENFESRSDPYILICPSVRPSFIHPPRGTFGFMG